MFDTTILDELLLAVQFERERQFDQWGTQSHPSVYAESNLRQYERKAETYKQINDARAELGELTWDGILLEEVYEALSETEPSLRIVELVQVAAVALAEAECLALTLADFELEDEQAVMVPVPAGYTNLGYTSDDVDFTLMNGDGA